MLEFSDDEVEDEEEGDEDSARARDDVYTAAAFGDLEKLHRLVEEGCSVSQPDNCGYSALQWSALNNRVATAQYIIEVLLSLSPYLILLISCMYMYAYTCICKYVYV